MNTKSCGTSCGCSGPSKSQYILTAVLLVAGLFYFVTARTDAQARDTMPGLVIYNGMGMGGLGRLDYDDKRRAYTLLDGRFTAYVVDGDDVRPMRVDEGGGTMAIPTDIASMDGAIYGFLPSYNALMKINPDTSLDKLSGYGPFQYGGGMQRRMGAHNSTLFFVQNNTVMAFDAQLNKLGELKIDDIYMSGDDFIIAGDRLYYLQSVNTRPYTDCVAPEPSPNNAIYSCGEQYTVMLEVDISDPAHMKLLRNEKQADATPSVYSRFKAYDAKNGHWLVAAGSSPSLELRKSDSFAKVTDSMQIKGKIVALTPTAPVYALRWDGARMILNAISTAGDKITMGPDFDIGLTEDYGDITMKRRDGRLFITARSYLRVVETGKRPEMILIQDFRDNSGDRFQITNFALADNLPDMSSQADRARLGAILKLDYISRERMVELQSEIDKLTPDDAWAVPLLIGALEKKGGSAYSVHPLAAEGLGNTGAAAYKAIPALLNASMSGAAIRGDYTPHLIAALKRIDPEGSHVVAALPAFEKERYTAGARAVAKDILTALPGKAAKAALANYK